MGAKLGPCPGRGPGPLSPKRTRKALKRQGRAAPDQRLWGCGVGGRPERVSGPSSGPRPLHLPRTPRRPRRSSWPTRWRPEWRPGTTASLHSGLSARSKCCRRGPVAGPALSFVGPRGRGSPSWSASRLRLRRNAQTPQRPPGTRANAQAGRAASREASRRGRHGAPLPRLLRKLVRARAREALGADVEAGRGNGD